MQRLVLSIVVVFPLLCLATAARAQYGGEEYHNSQGDAQADSSGFRVGDIVFALDGCALQDGATRVANLPKGTQLRVVHLNGDWVGCTALVDCKTKGGWVKKSLVAKETLITESKIDLPETQKESPPMPSANAFFASLPIETEGLICMTAIAIGTVVPFLGVFVTPWKRPSLPPGLEKAKSDEYFLTAWRAKLLEQWSFFGPAALLWILSLFNAFSVMHNQEIFSREHLWPHLGWGIVYGTPVAIALVLYPVAALYFVRERRLRKELISSKTLMTPRFP